MKTKIVKALFVSLIVAKWFVQTAFTQNSLDISRSGTNVQLHWFAVDSYILETAANLPPIGGWTPVVNFIPVQIGDAEYTFTQPLDATMRFFRLSKGSLPDDRPVLSLRTAALSFDETNRNTCFAISNVGGNSSLLVYAVSADVPWLSVSPATGWMVGGQSNTLCVAVDDSELFSGTYRATITISDLTGMTLKTIAITLIVPSAKLVVVPSGMYLSIYGAGQESDFWGQYYLNWSYSDSLTTNANYLEGYLYDGPQLYYQQTSATPYSSGTWSANVSVSQSSPTRLSASCVVEERASVADFPYEVRVLEESGQTASSFSILFQLNRISHYRVTGNALEEIDGSGIPGSGAAVGNTEWRSVSGSLNQYSQSVYGSSSQEFNETGVLHPGLYLWSGGANAAGYIYRSYGTNNYTTLYSVLPSKANLNLILQLY